MPATEIPSAGFTCIASSSLSDEHSCENVYRRENGKEGWVTDSAREGSWIKIEFHQLIRISKIVYRHNEHKYDYKCCNRNFKDLSLHFSDGSIGNMTVDDVFERDTNVDFLYRIYPPKISSHLLLKVNAVYDHYEAASVSNHNRERYAKNRFGISSLRVLGKIEAGKVTR